MIEDNAHGLFATTGANPRARSDGCRRCQFHETKNFICGEGGALVLNDAHDIERAHMLLDKGTNRAVPRRHRRQVHLAGLGSSFGLSESWRRFSSRNSERPSRSSAARRRLVERYRTLLEPNVAELGITLPSEPETATPADHMFYVLLDVRRTNDKA